MLSKQSMRVFKSILRIYFDLVKAFDVVPHEHLRRKVESFGNRGELLCWLQDWWNEKVQQTCINEHLPSWRNVTITSCIKAGCGPVTYSFFWSSSMILIQELKILFWSLLMTHKLVAKIRCHEDGERGTAGATLIIGCNGQTNGRWNSM